MDKVKEIINNNKYGSVGLLLIIINTLLQSASNKYFSISDEPSLAQKVFIVFSLVIGIVSIILIIIGFVQFFRNTGANDETKIITKMCIIAFVAGMLASLVHILTS